MTVLKSSKQSLWSSIDRPYHFNQLQLQNAKLNLSNFNVTAPFNREIIMHATAQKMKFFIKDFFRKCEQIRSFLQIWSHLLKKALTENFFFCAVCIDWHSFLK